MKAVICTKYGSPEVLQLKDLEKPTPKGNELLIKIYATTVHIGDTKIRSFKPSMGFFKDLFIKPMMRILIGFSGPRKQVLGMELSGQVEAIGDNVTLFKKGDLVFASTEMNFGTYAEYTCVPEGGVITKKPKNMSHSEAAPVPNGGLTALLLLRKARIKQGQKVLIYGASGSVGTYSVQFANHFGAEVTGVCSTSNLAMVKCLGAENVIDYTTSNFHLHDQTYDVILDAVGKLSTSLARKSLKQGGVYLHVLTSTYGLKLISEDLNYLKALIEDGKLISVIDKRYPLAKIVEAHRYVEQGHKKGNVVINVT